MKHNNTHGTHGARKSGRERRGGVSRGVRSTRYDTTHLFAVDPTDLTPAQREAWAVCQQNAVVFLTGPAGTGKTRLAAQKGLHDLLCTKTVRKLVPIRPAVEAGERLGFLPGDPDAKLDPYLRPIHDALDDLAGESGELRETVEAACEKAAVAFLRGRTFKRSCVLVDEAQNLTLKQMKMVLTRIGEGSQLIITGDPGQSDLPASEDGALAALCKRLARVDGVGVYEFRTKDQIRHPVVERILRALGEE